MKLFQRLDRSRSSEDEEDNSDGFRIRPGRSSDSQDSGGGFRRRARTRFARKPTSTPPAAAVVEHRHVAIYLVPKDYVATKKSDDLHAEADAILKTTLSLADDDDEEEEEVDDRIPPEVFLKNFSRNGSECICAAYLMDHPLYQSTISRTWFTTLPEDVFTLLDAQTSILNEYLKLSGFANSKNGDVILAEASLGLIQNLLFKQKHFFPSVLAAAQEEGDTMIHYVATANDLFLMNEKAEEMLERLSEGYAHVDWAKSRRYLNVDDSEIDDKRYALLARVRRASADLTSQLSRDAVAAAHRASSCVMRALNASEFIGTQLFSRKWEDDFVHSEVAVAVIRIVEFHRVDLEDGLTNGFLYNKVMTEVVRSTVCFYLRHLVEKADRVRTQRRNRKPIRDKIRKRDWTSERFASPGRAIKRVAHDLETLGEYFLSVAKDAEQSAPLVRSVKKELFVLTTVLEILWAAVDDRNSLEEFVLVLHKRTGADSEVTKQFLSDVWLLFAPDQDQRKVADTINVMQAELQLLSLGMREESRRRIYTRPDSSEDCSDDPLSCLRLEKMLRVMYDERNSTNQPSTFCGALLEDVEQLKHDLPPVLKRDDARRQAIKDLTLKLRSGLAVRRPFQKDGDGDEKKEQIEEVDTQSGYIMLDYKDTKEVKVL